MAGFADGGHWTNTGGEVDYQCLVFLSTHNMIRILHQATMYLGYMEQNTRHLGTPASHTQRIIRMCHVPDVTLIAQLL